MHDVQVGDRGADVAGRDVAPVQRLDEPAVGEEQLSGLVGPGSPMITALPPPWSSPASAFLYDMARASRNASDRAASSDSYGWKRVPPRAAPRAVEWIATIARNPVARS